FGRRCRARNPCGSGAARRSGSSRSGSPTALNEANPSMKMSFAQQTRWAWRRSRSAPPSKRTGRPMVIQLPDRSLWRRSMSHGITRARSSSILGLLLACSLGGALFPTAANAQKRPANNMWTRSARLYLDRARGNPRLEERRDLYRQALEAIKNGIEEDSGNAQVWLIAGQ